MTRPRCDQHRTADVFPAACPTCSRIKVEQDIVTRTVHALLTAGYQLNVNNGGDDDELPHYTDKAEAVLAVLMDTDDEYLLARKPFSGDTKWVRFVYGNDGWDVINDYLTSLESVIGPICDYASELGGQS